MLSQHTRDIHSSFFFMQALCQGLQGSILHAPTTPVASVLFSLSTTKCLSLPRFPISTSLCSWIHPCMPFPGIMYHTSSALAAKHTHSYILPMYLKTSLNGRTAAPPVPERRVRPFFYNHMSHDFIYHTSHHMVIFPSSPTHINFTVKVIPDFVISHTVLVSHAIDIYDSNQPLPLRLRRLRPRLTHSSHMRCIERISLLLLNSIYVHSIYPSVFIFTIFTIQWLPVPKQRH